MKILEIAGSGTIGTDQMGPVSEDIFSLSNYFSRQGHEVVIIDAKTSVERKHLLKRVKLAEVNCIPRSKVCSKNEGRLKRIVKPWINEYRLVNETRTIIDFSYFDVVHAHESVTARMLQNYKIPRLVYTSHTPTWCNSNKFRNESIKQSLLKKVYLLLGIHEINVIKNSWLTIALGNYLKNEIPYSNIEVIPNGIELNKFLPVSKENARNALNLKKKDFIITFVARIAPIKGIDVFLKALSLLKTKGIVFHANIIGSLSGSFNQRFEATPFANRMLKMAQGLPVCFRGFISNTSDEFRNYLASSDLFVLPSLFEPQGKVVLEALAMGIPVIASRVGGIPLMLTDNVGYTFEAGNCTELAKYIEKLYWDRERLKLMQKHCRAHVRDNFSWRSIAEQYIWVFREYINE